MLTVRIYAKLPFIVFSHSHHKKSLKTFFPHLCTIYKINADKCKPFAATWGKFSYSWRVFCFSFCSSSLLVFLAEDFWLSSSLLASSGFSSSCFTLLSAITSPLSLLALLSFNFPSRRFMSFLSGIGLFRMPLEPRAVAPLRGFTPLSSLSSPSSSSSSSRSGSHQKMTSHKDFSG